MPSRCFGQPIGQVRGSNIVICLGRRIRDQKYPSTRENDAILTSSVEVMVSGSTNLLTAGQPGLARSGWVWRSHPRSVLVSGRSSCGESIRVPAGGIVGPSIDDGALLGRSLTVATAIATRSHRRPRGRPGPNSVRSLAWLATTVEALGEQDSITVRSDGGGTKLRCRPVVLGLADPLACRCERGQGTTRPVLSALLADDAIGQRLHHGGEVVTRVVQVLGDPAQAQGVHVVGERRQVLLLCSLADDEAGRAV